jgi:hypothetical protein
VEHGRVPDGERVVRNAPPPGDASEPRLRLLVRYAASDGVPARSLRVALVVGTLLNLINQGDALLKYAPVSWFKLLLTFAMPYAVSTYGAAAVRWSDRTRFTIAN